MTLLEASITDLSPVPRHFSPLLGAVEKAGEGTCVQSGRDLNWWERYGRYRKVQGGTCTGEVTRYKVHTPLRCVPAVPHVLTQSISEVDLRGRDAGSR